MKVYKIFHNQTLRICFNAMMLLFLLFLIDFFVFRSIYIIFASPNTKLTYGVTVALQILDLSVQVRILVSQLKRPVINSDKPGVFLFSGKFFDGFLYRFIIFKQDREESGITQDIS